MRGDELQSGKVVHDVDRHFDRGPHPDKAPNTAPMAAQSMIRQVRIRLLVATRSLPLSFEFSLAHPCTLPISRKLDIRKFFVKNKHQIVCWCKLMTWLKKLIVNRT